MTRPSLLSQASSRLPGNLSAQSLPDQDTFIFALQLEYLEADFYWWAVKVRCYTTLCDDASGGCRLVCNLCCHCSRTCVRV